jgi:hypothetical protein
MLQAGPQLDVQKRGPALLGYITLRSAIPGWCTIRMEGRVGHTTYVSDKIPKNSNTLPRSRCKQTRTPDKTLNLIPHQSRPFRTTPPLSRNRTAPLIHTVVSTLKVPDGSRRLRRRVSCKHSNHMHALSLPWSLAI